MPTGKIAHRHKALFIVIGAFAPLASFALFHMVTVFPLSWVFLYTQEGPARFLVIEAIGAAFGGAMGMATTSGPGLAGALLAAGGTVIIAGALLGDLADDARGGFTAGQTGATVLWLATAAALLLRGLRGSAFAVPAGLAITALSVGKLLFFDLAFLDGIPRVLSFIVGGLIVLGMGTGYAQALERSRREPEPRRAGSRRAARRWCCRGP